MVTVSVSGTITERQFITIGTDDELDDVKLDEEEKLDEELDEEKLEEEDEDEDEEQQG